jgi:hypothetical protein
MGIIIFVLRTALKEQHLNRLIVFAGAVGLLACGGAVESNKASTASSSTVAAARIPYTPIHGASSVGPQQGGWMVDSSTDKMDDVTTRFDGGPPAASYWSESTDHEAVFSPNPIALARKLSKTKLWLVEFTPFETGPVTTSFQTEGLAAILDQVASACKWK